MRSRRKVAAGAIIACLACSTNTHCAAFAPCGVATSWHQRRASAASGTSSGNTSGTSQGKVSRARRRCHRTAGLRINQAYQAVMMVAEESSSAGMVDVQQYLLTAEADPKEEWRVLHRGLVATLKAADGDGAVALYMAVRKRGYTVPRGIYNGVINLCGNSSRVAVGLQIFEHMREAGHLPQENSYAFLVRERASRGAFAEGLQLVTDMVAQGLAPRLRTYAPLLQGLCAVPDMTMAWRVWAHMKGQGVVATPDLYVTMLRGASLSGDLWSMVATGEVDALLAELSYEVFELDGDLIEQLQQAFNAGLQEPVASMVSVESGGKGSCPACTSHLKAIGLTPREREKVRRALRVMATEKFPANGSAKASSSAGGNGDSGSGSSSSSAAAADTLLNFAQWLRERAKFTAVVDAPNVAYHNQNFPGGCFQMAQVDAVVQKLEARGERVLVVCPERYLRAIIPNSTRFARLQRKRTVLSPQALAIIRSWEEKGILYRCANTDNDDWYWMYLTVAFDNVAAPVTVVSNDLMRDHRLALLEPTPFVRWKRTQQMRYYFPRVALEGSTESLEVDLFDPPPFTRDIQVSDAGIWHLPKAGALQDPPTDVASEQLAQQPAVDGGIEEGAGGERGHTEGAGDVEWLCIDMPSGLRQKGLLRQSANAGASASHQGSGSSAGAAAMAVGQQAAA